MKETQLNLLSMFGFIGGDGGMMDELAEEPAMSKESYLRKGEKIISLLRERKGYGKGFVPSTLLEVVDVEEYQKRQAATGTHGALMYILGKLERGLIQPAIQSGKKENFEALFGEFAETIAIKECEDKDRSLMYSLMMSQQGKYDGNCFSLEFPGFETRNYYDVKAGVIPGKILFPVTGRMPKKYSGKSYRMRSEEEGSGYRYGGNGSFLSLMVLLFMLREEVRKRLSEEEDLQDSVLYRLLEKSQKNVFQKYEMEDGNYLIYEEALNCRYIKEYLNREEIGYSSVSAEEYLQMQEELKSIGNVMTEGDFIAEFLRADTVSCEEIHVTRGYDDIQSRNRMGLLVPGCLRLEKESKMLLRIFNIVADVYQEEKRVYELEKGLKKDFAASWETKKNIPDKVIQEMIHSRFNQWFGYVEFDSECDLKKVAELAKEWDALAEYFGFCKREEVSLRFRKLGHHRAAGLYCSFYKCICVDVRQLTSMTHEYMHMLDHEYGELSGKYSFYSIREKYEELLRDAMKKTDDLEMLHKLNGKTKYNLSYYLTPTEVFARCGEMYVTRCCQIENSLAENKHGFAYPEDEELLGMIHQYYSKIIGTVEKRVVSA